MSRAIGWILTVALLVASLFGVGAVMWTANETDRALQQGRQLVENQRQEALRLQEESRKQEDQLAQLQQASAEMNRQVEETLQKTARYHQLLEITSDSGQPLDTQFTHYRNLLGESGQVIYDRLRVSFLQGQVEVEVPDRATLSFDALFEIYVGVLMDDPGLFQFHKELEGNYTGTAAGNTAKPKLLFQGDALDTARLRFNAEAQAVLGQAGALGSDLDKVKYIHDYLAETVEYDLNAANGHEAYGAMVDKRAVCDGYAMAFKYYMNQLGIPAACVTGTADGVDHAWNIVMLEGTYYNLDITWDDPVGLPARTWTYDYFLLSDASMDATHTRDERSRALPACPSARYEGQFRFVEAA